MHWVLLRAFYTAQGILGSGWYPPTVTLLSVDKCYILKRNKLYLFFFTKGFSGEDQRSNPPEVCGVYRSEDSSDERAFELHQTGQDVLLGGIIC